MSLHPSVELSQEWNDNVFYNSRDTKSDSVTRAVPALAFSQNDESGHTKMKVGGTAKRYNRYDELDTFDPFVSFDVDAVDERKRATSEYGLDVDTLGVGVTRL